MNDTLAQVQAHLDRLRAKDPALADALQAVVEKIEEVDPEEACRTWAEKAEQRKLKALNGRKAR